MNEQPSDAKPPPADADRPISSSSISEAGHPAETQDLRRPGANPADPTETMPATYGRYVVLRVLGRGSFGTVYLGHDHQLDRRVAIKVHRSDRELSDDHLQDFLREARRVARLRHPGIAAVHDVGVEDDCVFMVADFVEGATLRDRIRRQPFTWQEAVRIVIALADALAHAHSLRIVHRDIKPANIILTAELKPILVDFGLGLDDAAQADEQRGTVAGTPAYMAPEQAAGQAHRIDGRTDIYALGVVLYELITGHVPFRGANNEELLRQVREDEPQPPRQLVPHIPRELEQVCLKALAKKVNDRFTTAGDLAEELTRLLDTTVRGSSGGESPSVSIPSVTPLSGSAPTAPGRSMAEAPAEVSPSSIKREAERRQLTLLTCSCDLLESAEFSENLDYEEQHLLLHDYQEACANVITQYGGTVLQMTEQMTLACFGFPIAFEDAASRAVRTGLGILRSIAVLRAKWKNSKGIDFTLGVCVHTGMAVVSDAPDGPGRDAFSVVGEARNVITRLDSVVRHDAVVISQSTYRLVHGFFLCESLGNTAVKGLARPIEFFKVMRENETASRIDIMIPSGLTPLVGRDREVGLMQDRWEQAVEGMGQVVLIIGEAGLGKSRLIHVIKEHVASASAPALTPGPSPEGRGEMNPPIVEWRCTPQHHHSSLHPVIEFLERYLHFLPEDTSAQRLQKLHDQLAPLGLATAEIMPFLAELLSLPLDDRFAPIAISPVRQKEKTFDAILECMRVYAAKQPFLFIVEDLHWVDPSTLELLALHVEAGLHEGILTILTFRPEFETPWKSKAHQTVMALNRLTKKQMTQMMQQKTGVKVLPPALVEQIVAKTDGVPLFVEEYTRMVIEAGNFTEVDGNVEMTGSYVSAEIPATLLDLLMARLDRMASNREVVQVGAAIGREFSYAILKAVLPIDEQVLQKELDKLVTAELLYQKGKAPESSYSFKHALIQDAAYQSLLKSKKQQVHRRIAVALETQLAELADKEPEVLAHHFTEASLLAPAIQYWTKAGQRSMGRWANAEAASHLGRGLELLATLPDTAERSAHELSMQITLGTVLIASQGYAAPKVGPIFARARELCLKIGQPQSLMAVLWGIWAWRVVREELDACMTLAAEMLQLAEAQADDGMIMEAHFVHGLNHYYRGEFAKSVEHCRAGLARFDAERCKIWSRYTGQNSAATERCYLALSLWCLGYPDQALRIAQDAVAYANEIAHPYTQCFAHHHLGWLQHLLRLGKETQTSAEAEVRVATEQGFPFWKATGTMCRAIALVLLKKPAQALEEARAGLAMFRATGAELSLTHYLSYFAEAHWQLGQHAEALTSVDDAIAAAARSHNDFYLAELYRLKGEILLSQTPSDPVAAEACFVDSLALAQKQDAKSWELRTTLSLSKLWQRQGRQAEARERLASVFAWFTEGFATFDLVDAKKCLDDWN